MAAGQLLPYGKAAARIERRPLPNFAGASCATDAEASFLIEFADTDAGGMPFRLRLQDPLRRPIHSSSLSLA
jgi:hypothetical protein